MRHLLPALLLLASPLAGADQVRLQVSATILSHCQLSSTRVAVHDGEITTSVARCRGSAAVPYRVITPGMASTGALAGNTATTIATTRRGEVLTVEF